MLDAPGLAHPISRRTLLKSFGFAGAAGLVLAGCSAKGGTNTGSGLGNMTISFSNYQGWIGPHTVQDFQNQHPGVKVHQAYTAGSFTDLIPKIKQQPGLYDMALGSIDGIARAQQLGLVSKMDFASMPNLKHIDPNFLHVDVNSHGDYFVPTDNGKVGIGVRTDLVNDDITSWSDLWKIAPKYKGHLYVYDYEADLMGTAMLYLGYKVNSRDPDQIEAAGKALEQLKPSIGSLTTSGISGALANGTAALAVDYDYEVFAAQQKNPNVKWIAPQEGMTGYLEGWIAMADGKKLDAIQEFTNFAFDPKQYAPFVAANDVAYVEHDIQDLLPKNLSGSPILFPSEDVLKTITFEEYLGEAETLYDKAYTKFKAA